MDRREGTRASCVQRLQKIVRLTTSTFSNDDAVRAVAKRRLQQFPNAHRRHVPLRSASFEANDVSMSELQFRCVLNDD